MSKERDCAVLIRKIVGEARLETFVCIVKSVDGTTCDVERLSDGKAIADVRLNAHIMSADGIVITPKAGSYVMATSINGDKWFVSQFSAITAFSYKDSSGVEITVNDGKITINGGALGGMVKVVSLLEKINRLEDKLKNHQHAYIPYPGGSPGAPIATTPASAAAPPDTTLVFTNTQRGDIENEKIKQ
jgi:hypothetical protein